MPLRVSVFIDYSNAYYAAREVFGDPDADPMTFGHVKPQRLGVLLKQLGEDLMPERELVAVTAYLGKPDERSGPVRQAAFGRQMSAWQSQPLVTVRTRPLRYRVVKWSAEGPTQWKGREKGIDVMMALDVAIGARDDAYDVGIIVSADHDLVPAIEVARDAGKYIETAMWWSESDSQRRLLVPGSRLWNHRLTETHFRYVRDDTDYAAAPRRVR